MADNVNELCGQLASSNAAEQLAAAEALARLGEGAKPAAAELVKTCGTSDPSVREWCIAALEELGPPPVAQIGDLITLARDRSPEAAYWATTLLGRMGDSGAPAVGTLVQILSESTVPSVRERAAWALGKIGPAAEPARRVLSEVAASEDARLSRLAQRALEAITT